MRFLLDAGVPRTIQNFLETLGFDALRLSQTKLWNATDEKVFSWAQKENRIIVTRDKGFGDIRSYPPGKHAGIIIIKDPNLSAAKIAEIFRSAWAEMKRADFERNLIIIDRKKVRLRKH